MKAQSTLDKWFMRVKDGIIISSALGAILLFMVKYYQIPDLVEAQAKEIQQAQTQISQLQEYTIKTDGRMARIEDGQVYTNKGIDDLKGWMKSLSRRPIT